MSTDLEIRFPIMSVSRVEEKQLSLNIALESEPVTTEFDGPFYFQQGNMKKSIAFLFLRL